MSRIFSLFVLVGFFLAGCGSVPMQSQEVSETAKLFPLPPQGKAGLYIFRTDTLRAGFVGGLLKKDIWIDGKCIGESAAKTFFYEEVAAGGEHTISTESNPFLVPNELELIPEAGKNYFIEQYMEMTLGGAKAKLRLVDEEAGRAGVARANMVANGTCSQYGTELRKIQTLAHQGDATAQFQLALLYWLGNSVPKDLPKAVKWFQKSAERGSAQGQSHLGSVYQYGIGVPKDERKAAEWFQKAANQGNTVAQLHLGLMYVTGQGVMRDQQKGCELLHPMSSYRMTEDEMRNQIKNMGSASDNQWYEWVLEDKLLVLKVMNYIDFKSGMAASNFEDFVNAHKNCAK
jgi:hypothetical protein